MKLKVHNFIIRVFKLLILIKYFSKENKIITREKINKFIKSQNRFCNIKKDVFF